MAYTVLPPSHRSGLSYDEHQFGHQRARHPRFDFTEFSKVSFKRVKGRRHDSIPDFANSNQGLQEALVKYLEGRFRIKPSGDIPTRLERCREAAKKTAAPTQALLKRGIKQYKALTRKQYHELPFSMYRKVFCARLRGESDEKLIETHAKQVRVWDSEVTNLERAPEVALSILYQSLRLGYDSPSVAETLGLRAPAVRQILSRAIKRAVRKTDTPNGRPKKVKK